jgi:hypothetical protein
MVANPRIAGFFGGQLPDGERRYLRELQNWPDERLESVHDFIQWMFPLLEPSPVNPEAPVLDEETIALFHARPELREALRASWLRMLDFYGLELSDGQVRRAASFAAKSPTWLHPNSHNHLRISRILKCLRLLGLEEEACAFFDCLVDIYASERRKPRPGITERTFEFWQNASGAG